MLENEKYSWLEIDYLDYDFNFFDDIEIITKMLNEQQPKVVERFDSTGTNWDLWNYIEDYFELYIEGAMIQTNTDIGCFVEDFLLFLPQLAATDDKTLICPFEDEGSAYMFTTVPEKDNCIRVSVFHSSMVHKYDPETKFMADISINKETFLKQMREILELSTKVKKQERTTFNHWVDKIKYIISELDKYFNNPEKYKKEYEHKRHIRTFDVAYKALDNKWKFEVYIEGDEKAKVDYWEKQKDERKILDYSYYDEGYEDLFVWGKDYKQRFRLSLDEVREMLKKEINDRINCYWEYSKARKKWCPIY